LTAVGLLDHDRVPGLRDHDHLRVSNAGVQPPRRRRRRGAVVLADDDQRRHPDAAELPREVRA
jgi:hypothetical protein